MEVEKIIVVNLCNLFAFCIVLKYIGICLECGC